MNEKVLVAMSGGVDSSVAAALLHEAGYRVSGVTLKMSGGTDDGPAADAKRVTEALGIEHRVLDVTRAFSENVVGRFVRGYRSGLTPNPCIECNRYIKFGVLFDEARKAGMDYLATGHYARIERDPKTGRFLLKKAADPSKDQSYVLYSLTQERLAHTLLPLGEYKKAGVYAIAKRYGFKGAERESQEICFIPDHDHSAFIARVTGERDLEGDFIDAEGNVLGRHRGITRYTIGQRKGLGVSLGRPVYVVAIDPRANTVTLGEEKDLYSSSLIVKDLNVVSGERIEGALRVQAKLRYAARPQDATFIPLCGGAGRIDFDAPQRAVTPGQACVFYQGDVVVGGGTIARRL